MRLPLLAAVADQPGALQYRQTVGQRGLRYPGMSGQNLCRRLALARQPLERTGMCEEIMPIARPAVAVR